jgi:hypothetical protein
MSVVTGVAAQCCVDPGRCGRAGMLNGELVVPPVWRRAPLHHRVRTDEGCVPSGVRARRKRSLFARPVQYDDGRSALWGGLSNAFVSINDEQCARAMRALAHPSNGDPVVVAGASGACGLAALLAILQDERLRPVREASGVSVRSRVLVINTEGATDPELYVQVTGRDASTVSTTYK